jgi:hypothetical protein
MATTRSGEPNHRDPRVNAPTPHERKRLSVATLGIDDRTILRAYADPTSVRESTLLRLRHAARELGLQPPTLPIGKDAVDDHDPDGADGRQS